MPLYNPYSLRLEITRLFEQGQSFFAPPRVEAWLKQHNRNPAEYDVTFHQEIAPPGSAAAMLIRIELTRKDGQPIDPWLEEAMNSEA